MNSDSSGHNYWQRHAAIEIMRGMVGRGLIECPPEWGDSGDSNSGAIIDDQLIEDIRADPEFRNWVGTPIYHQRVFYTSSEIFVVDYGVVIHRGAVIDNLYIVREFEGVSVPVQEGDINISSLMSNVMEHSIFRVLVGVSDSSLVDKHLEVFPYRVVDLDKFLRRTLDRLHRMRMQWTENSNVIYNRFGNELLERLRAMTKNGEKGLRQNDDMGRPRSRYEILRGA